MAIYQKFIINYNVFIDISFKIGNNPETLQIFKKSTPLPLKRNVNVEFDVNSPFISILESDTNILAKVAYLS